MPCGTSFGGTNPIVAQNGTSLPSKDDMDVIILRPRILTQAKSNTNIHSLPDFMLWLNTDLFVVFLDVSFKLIGCYLS